VLATLSALEVLYVIGLWLLVLTPAVVVALKGHIALFVIGFLTIGMVWLVGAFRLARPNAPWARRFYGPEKMRRSEARYPHVAPGTSSNAIVALGIALGAFGVVFLGGFVAGRLA
jgi:heme O synthase-like polyprenyltransferase